jgi:hypothetical protein
MHPAVNDHDSIGKRRKRPDTHPTLYVPLPTFGLPLPLPEPLFCCEPSRTVADCRADLKLSRFVSNCCALLPIASSLNFSARSPSRNLSGVPLVYEGCCLADNWIPETRNRLAQRRAKKPDTKAGQIWALWPEIKAALEDGQSFRSLCQWLHDDAGLSVSIPSLRSYISRSRRKDAALRRIDAESAFLRAAVSGELQPSKDARPGRPRAQKDRTLSKPEEVPDRPGDPMAGALRALKKTKRFDIRDVHGDGDPSGKDLI